MAWGHVCNARAHPRLTSSTSSPARRVAPTKLKACPIYSVNAVVEFLTQPSIKPSWKYHTCHSSEGIVVKIRSHGRAGVGWGVMWGGSERSTEARTRGAFEYRWPYMHAVFIVGWITWIAHEPAAPGWGCHGYRAPQTVSLYRTLTFWRSEFAQKGGKLLCCWGADSSCEAGKSSDAEIVPTRF